MTVECEQTMLILSSKDTKVCVSQSQRLHFQLQNELGRGKKEEGLNGLWIELTMG
jgi:hypothetical protein